MPSWNTSNRPVLGSAPPISLVGNGAGRFGATGDGGCCNSSPSFGFLGLTRNGMEISKSIRLTLLVFFCLFVCLFFETKSD